MQLGGMIDIVLFKFNPSILNITLVHIFSCISTNPYHRNYIYGHDPWKKEKVTYLYCHDLWKKEKVHICEHLNRDPEIIFVVMAHGRDKRYIFATNLTSFSKTSIDPIKQFSLAESDAGAIF